MKIRITLAGNDRVAIILPIESAGIAASLLASASVWERDGYHSTSGWKPADEGIKIEYTEHNKLKQQFGEMQAALDELRARTTCTAIAPDESAEVEQSGEEEE